jgi:hypothetical protein
MVLAPGIGKVFEDGLIQIILQREFAPMHWCRERGEGGAGASREKGAWGCLCRSVAGDAKDP